MAITNILIKDGKQIDKSWNKWNCEHDKCSAKSSTKCKSRKSFYYNGFEFAFVNKYFSNYYWKM